MLSTFSRASGGVRRGNSWCLGGFWGYNAISCPYSPHSCSFLLRFVLLMYLCDKYSDVIVFCWLAGFFAPGRRGTVLVLWRHSVTKLTWLRRHHCRAYAALLCMHYMLPRWIGSKESKWDRFQSLRISWRSAAYIETRMLSITTRPLTFAIFCSILRLLLLYFAFALWLYILPRKTVYERGSL